MLRGIPVERIWGGGRLRDIFSKPGAGEHTGETWELSLREREVSVITNGPLAEMTLAEFILRFGNAVVSDRYDGRRFPILVKFIDADDKLSIQVHPGDEYAAIRENDTGKTEMWYVVDAEPGAEIVYGIKNGLGKEDLRTAFDNGRLDNALNYIKVKPGDVFFIPAGMVHAIGGGILVAEIQQNCDLTYRVFDYNRRDAEGRLRELHIDKAFDVIRPFTADEINSLRMSAATADEAEDPALLAHCGYFKVKKHGIVDSLTLTASPASFHSLLFISGCAEICCDDAVIVAHAGDSIFVPAGTGGYTVSGRADFLICTVN